MDRVEEYQPIDLPGRIRTLRSVSEIATILAFALSVAILVMWSMTCRHIGYSIPATIFHVNFKAAFTVITISVAFWFYLHGKTFASLTAASGALLLSIAGLLERVLAAMSIAPNSVIPDLAILGRSMGDVMPVVSAIVLVALSAVVIVFNISTPSPARNIAIHIVCLAVMAVGFETIAARLAPPVVRLWPGFPGQVTLPGAICAVALCTAMLAHSLQSEITTSIRLSLWIPLLYCFLIAGLDFRTPLGLSIGIAYIPLVFCALWYERTTIVIDFAALATILILMGIIVKPRGDVALWVSFSNRSMAIVAVWLNAFLIHALLTARNNYRRNQMHLSSAQRIAGSGSFEIDFKTMALRGSRAFDAMHGRSSGDNASWNDSMAAIIAPEDQPAILQMIDDARAGLTPPAAEYSFIGPDGSARNALLHAQLMYRDNGAIGGIIGVVQDVTEARSAQRHQANIELQLRHAQKLESLGLLAGGIAHDLNNTLLPITMVAPMLSKTADPATRKGLDIIMNAAGRARELVREILIFSRKDPVAFEAVRIDLLVADALKILRAGIPANIDIVSDLTIVPEVTGSKGQLYQTILNLATNAAKAIGDGHGKITIGAQCDTQAHGPGNVRLYVADDGIGMDAETQQRVFEPFFTNRADQSGTGLGLSIVNGIVKAHGGSITVKSAPGAGTRFDLLFPQRIEGMAA